MIKGIASLKKILILEDNPAALEYLAGIVRELDPRNTIFTFDNCKDAYQCAMERTIDLFLVDIILDTTHPGDASGLKFVENMRKIEHYSFTPILFVTSLEDVRSYTYERLHCYSFIEKPFDVNKVKQTVNQCLRFPGYTPATKTLYFRKEGIILAVEREEIVYAESINHVMHIHTKQGDVLKLPYITIKKLLEETDSLDIVQCSRNAVINKNFVQNVDIPNRIIQMKGDFGRVEIGLMFKKSVKEKFR